MRTESDRVAQEFGGLIDDYAQFLSLVAEMRKLQKEQDEATDLDFANAPYYEAQYKKMIKQQEIVDKWLEEHYEM